MLVFDKKWKTKSTLDSRLLGKISHKVGPSVRSSISTSHQQHTSHNQPQTVLSRCESSNRLQTGIIPRRRFCRKFHRLKIKQQLYYPSSALKLKFFRSMQDLRMEGIPALTLWDTITDILRLQAGGDFKPIHQTRTPTHHEPFGDTDYVPPNARFFSMQTS